MKQPKAAENTTTQSSLTRRLERKDTRGRCSTPLISIGDESHGCQALDKPSQPALIPVDLRFASLRKQVQVKVANHYVTLVIPNFFKRLTKKGRASQKWVARSLGSMNCSNTPLVIPASEGATAVVQKGVSNCQIRNDSCP